MIAGSKATRKKQKRADYLLRYRRDFMIAVLEAKEIRFAELYNSDELLLPDECEFQAYTIMVQRIAHATKVDKAAPHKGRVLRDVVAEILGYREH